MAERRMRIDGTLRVVAGAKLGGMDCGHCHERIEFHHSDKVTATFTHECSDPQPLFYQQSGVGQ